MHIAASTNYANAQRWGSHPLIDPLWSTASTAFCHDGGEATRLQKVQWYVGQSDLALSHLRVCWDNYGTAYNCGGCPKCIRTMINLHIAGVLERSGTFAHTLDLEAIRALRVKDRLARYYLTDNLRALERVSADPELQEALREALQSFPAVRTALRELARDVDQRLLGGLLRRRHRVANPYGFPLKRRPKAKS